MKTFFTAFFHYNGIAYYDYLLSGTVNNEYLEVLCQLMLAGKNTSTVSKQFLNLHHDNTWFDFTTNSKSLEEK